MFYSETILSRRGPLGRVWLAAHMERKLSKSQTLQTDIEQSVDAIMGQEIELMALRLSGQLLLGVVRIYSRKAKYLLDDCNEALLKIKMAFRPGVVDLTEDQLTVNKTTITLQTNGVGLDLLLPDVDWDMDFEDRPLQKQGHHQAPVETITLPTTNTFGDLGEDYPPFEIGPTDGIHSEDYEGIDLGIDWDNEQNEKSDAMSVVESVEQGRRESISDAFEPDLMGGNDFGGVNLDALSNRSKSRDVSEQPFGVGMDIDTFGDIDLETLGIGFDAQQDDNNYNARTPSQTRSASRASSPLTELPQTPPPLQDIDANVEIADSAPPTEKVKRKMKDKKQIIDSVTELQNGLPTGARGRPAANANPLNIDVSNIITRQNFLPRSSIVMRLLEIRDDPVSYFLPTQTKANPNFFSAAPPGLTPELAALFIRPVPGSSPQKRKGSSPGPSPSKRARRDEVEMPRRAESVAPSEGMFNGTFDQGLDNSGFEFPDQSGMIEDFVLPEEANVQLDIEERAKSVVSNRSRYSSIDPEAMEDARVDDGTCLISILGATQPSQQTQSQAVDQEGEAVEGPDKHGYSKNTVKALGLIRKELQPGVDEGEGAEMLSFKKMSAKASRRAASSFFFELLVLGTRDCIKLSQPKPFSDIEIQAKPRLWEHQQHAREDAADDAVSESGLSTA